MTGGLMSKSYHDIGSVIFEIFEAVLKKYFPRVYRNPAKMRRLYNVINSVYMVGVSCLIAVLIISRIEYEFVDTYHAVYNGYEDRCLMTEGASFRLPSNRNTEVSKLDKLEPGDEITIEVSAVTHEVLNISHQGRNVFLKQLSNVSVGAIAFVACCFYTLGIIMYIIVNKKNPGKRIRKEQQRMGVWDWDSE